MTGISLSEQSTELVRHLGRGGRLQCLWHRKLSHWFNSGTVPSLPADRDVYFSLAPVNAIPERIDPVTGLPKPPERVRGGNAEIVALNCLFAEWDGKDYGGKDSARAHIETLVIPPAVLVDSGGGFHGYWLFPKPVRVTDDSRENLRRLQARWNAYVGGDPQAKDLARVLRLPGTLNTKYDPPRPVSFVWYDHDFVYLYGLQRHLNQFAPEPARPSPKAAASFVTQHGGLRVRAYGRAALDRELSTLASTPKGARNGQLNTSALKLGSLIAGGILDRAAVVGALTQTALSMTDASFTPREIELTINSGLQAGLKQPRGLPDAA
jgi:hypothetical protein